MHDKLCCFFDTRVTTVVYDDTHQQKARRQDLAATGPNEKWGGTDFKWGFGHHWAPRWRRPWPAVARNLREI